MELANPPEEFLSRLEALQQKTEEANCSLFFQAGVVKRKTTKVLPRCNSEATQSRRLAWWTDGKGSPGSHPPSLVAPGEREESNAGSVLGPRAAAAAAGPISWRLPLAFLRDRIDIKPLQLSLSWPGTSSATPNFSCPMCTEGRHSWIHTHPTAAARDEGPCTRTGVASPFPACADGS